MEGQYLSGVSRIIRYPLGVQNTPAESVMIVTYNYGVGPNSHNYTGYPTRPQRERFALRTGR